MSVVRPEIAVRVFVYGVGDALGRGGWDGVAQFLTEQDDEGRRFVATPDGKGGARVVALDADGKELGSQDFATPEGFILHTVAHADPVKCARRLARDASIPCATEDDMLRLVDELNAATSAGRIH